MINSKTLKTIVNTVTDLCVKKNFTFREHNPKDAKGYWSVVDDEGFHFIYNELELADYMSKLLKK